MMSTAGNLLRSFFFNNCKLVGLFRLSEILFRDRLQIVCFHGYSISDEHEFRPSLFMRKEVFERRILWLLEHEYNVVSLDRGLEMLGRGQLSRRTIVLTIDDGFASTLGVAAPILKAHGITATIYITSYYATHSNPIFGLAVQYLFWKTGCSTISREALDLDVNAASSEQFTLDEIVGKRVPGSRFPRRSSMFGHA